jgi:hypothetical protein
MDIRVPIGMMFIVLGVLLAGYGVVSDPRIYERSLGININLVWGSTLAVVGVVLLLLARRRQAHL